MDSKKEIYEIEFTEDCRDEIREVYKYISHMYYGGRNYLDGVL